MLDAAANIARIDPAQCRLPPGRLPVAPEHCAELANSIHAHSQLVPGLVRRASPGDSARYEIICGAARDGATVLAATAEILDNLCGVEKGWQVPTDCVFEMSGAVP